MNDNFCDGDYLYILFFVMKFEFLLFYFYEDKNYYVFVMYVFFFLY